MLKTVDYDQGQHACYRAGRDLGPENARMWSATFSSHMPARRPLAVLDLGCGTGRFTGALAETFGGPVYGVEPSDRMRMVAEESVQAPDVSFLAGQGEEIPLPDASVDFVLLFLSFHHVRDRAKAAAETRRVLRPGGRVMIRSPFADRFPDLQWHGFFPRARAIELEMFPALTTVEAVFAEVGLQRLALDVVPERFADCLADHAVMLHMRAISTFEHMSEDEMAEGFARLDAAVAAEQTLTPVVAMNDLLVLG
jgi:ubiquinone/menaquinone biosynthesis C-methylase UbiE